MDKRRSSMRNEDAGSTADDEPLAEGDVEAVPAGADEAVACGFEEVLLGPGVKVVEWAERLPFEVPGALSLALNENGEGSRQVAELERQPEPARD